MSSLTNVYIGCFAAAGVGVLGSVLDFHASRTVAGHIWPKLLNSAEMTLYAGCGVLFVVVRTCKIWANTVQLAGITVALIGSFYCSIDSFLTDILESGKPGSISPSAGRAIARGIIYAFVIMTALAAVVPLYRVCTGDEAGDTLRMLCNWILPIIILIGVPTITTLRSNDEATDSNSAGGENSSLLINNDNGQASDEKKRINPMIFGLLVLSSLIPVGVITILASIKDEGKCS